MERMGHTVQVVRDKDGRVIHREHVLKAWPEYFVAIWERRKLFELRRDDRDFQVGDVLTLDEFACVGLGTYTGRVIKARVDYVLRGDEAEQFGLAPGYCIMSIAPLHNIDVSDAKA